MVAKENAKSMKPAAAAPAKKKAALATRKKVDVGAEKSTTLEDPDYVEGGEIYPSAELEPEDEASDGEVDDESDEEDADEEDEAEGP